MSECQSTLAGEVGHKGPPRNRQLQKPLQPYVTGAQAVNKIPLTRIEVHGKNLFYFFGDEASPHIVHIHFGMSGAFKTMTLPGPEPTDTTRLTLVNQELGIIASLSAMTVVLGDLGKACNTTCLLLSIHNTTTILQP